MKLKSVIMDEAAVRRSMTRITHEIIEKNSGTADLILLGIHRRGMPLAAMLKDNIRRFEDRDVPIGSIDISLYRDDLTEISETPETTGCSIPVTLSDYTVVLIDDVRTRGVTFDQTADRMINLGAQFF